MTVGFFDSPTEDENIDLSSSYSSGVACGWNLSALYVLWLLHWSYLGGTGNCRDPNPAG